MEDALELGRAIALHGPTPEALRAYEAVRRAPPRCKYTKLQLALWRA